MNGATTNITDTRNLWLAELANNGASPWTLRNYKSATDEAFTAIAARRNTTVDNLTVTALDRDDIIVAIASYAERPDPKAGKPRKRAQSTLATYSTALRSFFAWCVQTEKLDRNPMAQVKRPKQPVRVPKAMDATQCKTLLATATASKAKERDTLMALMALTMGLRLTELATIRPEDFHPTVTDPTHLRVIGKGNKERRIPVPHVVRDALTVWLPVRQAQLDRRGTTATTLFTSQRTRTDGTLDVTRHTVGETFNRLLTDSGLKQKGRRVHVARHSFATLLLEAGTDIVALSELLGHSSIAVTNIYVRATPERMMAAVEANPLAQTDNP